MVIRTIVMVLLIAGSLLAQGSVSTFPAWNGTSYISSFGVVNTATYGQTFVVGSGPLSLDSVAFTLGYCGAPTTFRVSIYAWNGTMATGSSLFQSAPITVAGDNTYHTVTVPVGGVSLPMGTYVMFASTSQDQAGALNSACRWGSVGNNAIYPYGQFVFMNNGTDTAAWTASTWSRISDDLAFQVAFASGLPTTPIPGTIWLVLAGLVAAGLWWRFRPVSRSSTA